MMTSLASLWLPILVSAVGVFIASSLVHMVFKWHNADYRKLPNEDEVAAALRRQALPPGQYTVPHCVEMKDMQSPEMQKKFVEGPVGFITLRPNGLPNMGKHLGLWFALTLFVSLLAALAAGVALPIGAVKEPVFDVTFLLAFAAYGCGAVSDGIWMGRPWKAVAKDLLDAFIYAAVTGVAFALLWPR
ncbi:hypothetical protein [Solimonas soli]|uniref:hypothetical protein n=1 Tax=Solimonas soli TaxID=413479 RepID=UPI0012F83D01|nr:hypothetical protein [Solimonas soli]